MTSLIPCYIAHRLGAGADRETNRLKAQRWVAWLAGRYLIEPVAPWIILAAEWPESMRELGLEIDRAAIERCELVIACGEQVGLSAGMQLEAGWAKRVADITGYGWGLDGPARLRVIDRKLIDLALIGCGIEVRPMARRS